MRLARVISLTVVLAFAQSAGPAFAQAKQRVFKAGIGLGDDHPQALAIKRFGEILAEKTAGRLTVKLFASGALGNDATMISALRAGTQEITCPDSSTLVGVIKDFGVLNFPLAFERGEEADALLDGPFGQKLLAKLPERGLVGLAFWENGFRQITNARRAINNAADIAGLKIRVIQNPLFIDTFSALGANALPMPFPELYTALETRTVDGQENPIATILSSKFHEVQKHVALSRHIYSVWVLLLSKKIWDGLTAEEQTAVTSAAREATVYERATIRDYDNKALAELKKLGMQVSELAPAEQAKMREKLKPVTDKYAREFGEANAKEMLAELEKIRTAKPR